MQIKIRIQLDEYGSYKNMVLHNVGGYLITSDHHLYSVTPLKTPFIITIPITRNYNHSQLFLTLLHKYTAYVRNYNYLLHSYTG
jgi:hypothetical protein